MHQLKMENDLKLKTLILCYPTLESGYILSPDFLEKFNKIILIGSDVDDLDDIAYFLETEGKEVRIFQDIDQLINGPEASVLNDLDTFFTIYC